LGDYQLRKWNNAITWLTMMEKRYVICLSRWFFVQSLARGSMIVVTNFGWSDSVILINLFFNHTWIYFCMGETNVSYLILALKNSFSISLMSKLSYCNVSSTSSFLFT
jgi:hypothetical protein